MTDTFVNSIDWKLLCSVSALLLTYVVFSWNRRESRSEALSKVLEPFILAMQKLAEANKARLKAEKLKRSYPPHEKHPEVVERFNSFVQSYNDLVSAGADACKEFERHLASRKFRFPSKVGHTLQAVKEELFRLGELVNQGRFDQGDLQLARLCDLHRDITARATGWRIYDPLEGIRKYWGRGKHHDDETGEESEISKKRMERLLALIFKRATTQAENTFVVHPPTILLQHPEVATSDDVVEKLRDSIFEIVFQDGDYEMVTLAELMVFTYQLIFLAAELPRVSNALKEGDVGEATVNLSVKFSETQLMQPEMVKALLSKIAFSDDPADGEKTAA